jgi:hypothetical protein
LRDEPAKSSLAGGVTLEYAGIGQVLDDTAVGRIRCQSIGQAHKISPDAMAARTRLSNRFSVWLNIMAFPPRSWTELDFTTGAALTNRRFAGRHRRAFR